MNIKHAGLLILCFVSQTVLGSTAIPDTAVSACQLKPSRWADISSQIAEMISKLFHNEGSVVQKRDLLIGLDSREESSLLRLAEERSKFAQRKLSRNIIIKDSGLLPEQDADELETESKLAQLEAEQLQNRIDRSTIKSPFPGIVVRLNTEIGEKVSDEPLLSVANLESLHAEIVIDADWYRHAQTGDLLAIIIQGREKAVNGKIKTIDPLIDAASHTFTIIAELDNRKNDLIAGQRCGLATLNET